MRTAVLVALILFASAPMSGCYLSHVAGGQLRVITSSISVKEALRRDDLEDADKAKLRYIQDVKAFTETALGLRRSCSYSTYLPRDKEPLTYVVSASAKDALLPKTWWFPIVGTASYKGFFDQARAEEERDELLAEGYDVYLRTAGAYSTLGWFCDPVLPTMLDLDEGRLAALIIHELTHGTLYVPGDTVFNESLADFVAHESAPQFLAERFGPGNAYTASLQASIRSQAAMNGVLTALSDRLTLLYTAAPHDVLQCREDAFASARQEIAAVCATHKSQDVLCAPDAQLDNAVVLARLTYGTPERFAALYASVDHDWQRFWSVLLNEYAPDDWYPQ